MSRLQISLSPDLERLRSEGFDIEVRAGHLLVKGVPYVNAAREVNLGTLVSVLTLAGDVTTKPADHVIHFAGEYPCDASGVPLEKIRNQSNRRDLGEGVCIDHTFSAKPLGGSYADYHAKVTAYVAMLEGEAQVLKPNATSRSFPLEIDDANDASPFRYVDTATSNQELAPLARKLELAKVAIVGLGGTGSYVLDLVAKTRVKEIHLFDGDTFLQKNAFRSPGAPSLGRLREKPMKVEYFREVYDHMHQGISAHAFYLDDKAAAHLSGFDFVFLCVDSGSARKAITSALGELDIPFVDVGMGVQVSDDGLIGILRVTTSSQHRRDHLATHLSFAEQEGENEYNKNIQIADLNALNAALAVIRWKKLFGFYVDLEREHHCTYTLDGNAMTNEENA